MSAQGTNILFNKWGGADPSHLTGSSKHPQFSAIAKVFILNNDILKLQIGEIFFYDDNAATAIWEWQIHMKMLLAYND